MRRVTFDLANGMTVSIAEDLNCLSVAAYPTGKNNDLTQFHKFSNGQSDKRTYCMGDLIEALVEVVAK
jgi:hypothetical protein